MPKFDQQITTLQDRLTLLKLRQARADARKLAMNTLRERKRNTRRKILIGELIMAKVKEGQMDSVQLHNWLDQGLAHSDDRALFDLSARNKL